MKLWDLNDSEPKALRGHTSSVFGVSFSPDAQTIASVSGDNTIRLWSRNGTLLKTLEAPVKTTESTGIGFSVSFSPDGQTIAATLPDKTVKLWSRDGTLLKILKPQPTQVVADSKIPEVSSVSYSPDGQTIASGNSRGAVTLRSREGKLLKYFEVSMSRVWSLVFSPDSKMLAAAGASLTPETIILAPENLKTSNGQDFIQLWKPVDTSTECIPFLQKAQTNRHENSVSVWSSDSSSGNAICFTPTKTLKGHKGSILALSFSPNGKMIASASFDKTVKLWSHNGTLLKTFSGYKDPVLDVSFSPDGKRIATANPEGLKIWNLSGQLLAEFGGKEPVPGVGIRLSVDEQTKALTVTRIYENAPALRAGVKEGDRILEIDGKSTTGMSVDEANKLIRSKSGTQVILRVYRQGSEAFDTPIIRATVEKAIPYRSVHFSPDGQMIVSGSWDTVKLWSRDGILLKTLEGHGHPGPVNSVSFSPDGQTIASASSDKTVKLWSRDGKLLKTFDERSFLRQLDFFPALYGVNFSPDGKTIAASGTDGTVKLWNEDGTFIKTVQDGALGERSSSLSTSGNTSDMSFSPDGSTIAATEHDNTIKLYRRDGTLITTLQGHTGKVNSVSFSPDGQLIATASADNTVKLWNRNGTLRTTLTGHNDNIFSVSFSPDGQTIASASRDKTIKLWSRDGREIKTLPSRDFILDMTFSPDGKMLAAASSDQTVRLWDLDLDSLLVKSCNLVQNYLKTNPNVSKSDRHLCNGIGTSR